VTNPNPVGEFTGEVLLVFSFTLYTGCYPLSISNTSRPLSSAKCVSSLDTAFHLIKDDEGRMCISDLELQQEFLALSLNYRLHTPRTHTEINVNSAQLQFSVSAASSVLIISSKVDPLFSPPQWHHCIIALKEIQLIQQLCEF